MWCPCQNSRNRAWVGDLRKSSEQLGDSPRPGAFQGSRPVPTCHPWHLACPPTPSPPHPKEERGVSSLVCHFIRDRQLSGPPAPRSSAHQPEVVCQGPCPTLHLGHAGSHTAEQSWGQGGGDSPSTSSPCPASALRGLACLGLKCPVQGGLQFKGGAPATIAQGSLAHSVTVTTSRCRWWEEHGQQAEAPPCRAGRLNGAGPTSGKTSPSDSQMWPHTEATSGSAQPVAWFTGEGEKSGDRVSWPRPKLSCTHPCQGSPRPLALRTPSSPLCCELRPPWLEATAQFPPCPQRPPRSAWAPQHLRD